ncbi:MULTISPECIES: PP2C family protein-serine/threonine phosphatase [Actinosynnema]|uniref:PP2C family protein-serine/threonine phosphatase n=1 Tax=Actinosynnema TaxID=40566 RepID=UPI0020A572EF|nr:PP2C family protein-serine/threonine phosphatase [Actinosynnema pretiosum]
MGNTHVDSDTAWRTAPCPALLVGPDGTVLGLNRAASTLLPSITEGGSLDDGWLADAHRDHLEPARAAVATAVAPGSGDQAGATLVTGDFGPRSFAAHPVDHDDGTVAWWLVEDTERRGALAELAVERERAALLDEMSSALFTSLNVERCARVAVRLAAAHLADAALVISPGGRDYPVTRCARGESPAHTRIVIDPDEVPGLGEALRGFPPVPSRWIDPSAAPDWLLPDGFGEAGSILVTPLPGHGVPAGALILVRRTAVRGFSPDEEAFARLFAARAGVAMSAARMFAQQASITETLMRELLPPTLTHLGGVEFAGRYRPSQDTERVGGDFYDVHEGEDGESLVVLGDVCGKGLEAAVLTGKVRTALQVLLPMADDHHRMLTLLNEALLNNGSTRFVTLVLASVTREGTSVRLRLTSAGHPPPLIVRAGGEVEEADTTGTLIGVLPEIESTTAEVVLGPGETCLLYTDGITEARGGPMDTGMFGESRLRRALAECAGMPAEAVVEHVQMLAAHWVGASDHDDMAVLAVTAPRGQHLTAVGGHGPGRFTS